MIRTILITGLDGCGKSTLFSKLKLEKPDHVALITLPHIDDNLLPNDSVIQKQARLLNSMSQQADENNWSDLKALALFGSMLLYKQLVHEITTSLTRVLICERHPLIDPLIYARFYAERLTPDHLKREKMDYYNTTYNELLAAIVSLLPIESAGDYALEIFQFIHDTFKKPVDAQIKQLFNVELPDAIFFLKAPPEILFDRIAGRKVAEPHEQLQVLTLLDTTYDGLFESISATPIEYIDASGFETLDQFYDRLLDDITKSN